MRFLVFVPTDQSSLSKSPKDVLQSVGLGELAAGIDVRRVQGPEEKAGLLFGWLSPDQNQLRYTPSEQTWIPSAKHGDRESGAYWVGFWNSAPPTERDLRRPDVRKGNFVRLGNGESWSICDLEKLDRFPLLQPDGTLKWVVDERYNWLVTEVEKRCVEAIVANDEGGMILTFDLTNDWFWLVAILQINYRITPEVVSHLRLFSQESLQNLVAQVMGIKLQDPANV